MRARTAKGAGGCREWTLGLARFPAVASCRGDSRLGHGFHQTKQRTRFTISEAARQEVLGRSFR
jgi:hypothetical protein